MADINLQLNLHLHNYWQKKQRTRVKERIDKCVKEKLIVFYAVLNIPINKSSVKKIHIHISFLNPKEFKYHF
jgi:hypothetical protein